VWTLLRVHHHRPFAGGITFHDDSITASSSALQLSTSGLPEMHLQLHGGNRRLDISRSFDHVHAAGRPKTASGALSSSYPSTLTAQYPASLPQSSPPACSTCTPSPIAAVNAASFFPAPVPAGAVSAAYPAVSSRTGTVTSQFRPGSAGISAGRKSKGTPASKSWVVHGGIVHPNSSAAVNGQGTSSGTSSGVPQTVATSPTFAPNGTPRR
jgi:hypothetical protein